MVRNALQYDASDAVQFTWFLVEVCMRGVSAPDMTRCSGWKMFAVVFERRWSLKC